MSARLSFPVCKLPPEAEALRPQVREFLAQALTNQPVLQRAKSWLGFDLEFTKKLAARGWIGMVWPKEFGGGEKTAFERHVVVEELVAAGAPVMAHWIADRQSGPQILRFGTEAQKRKYLPPITRGDSCFAIGMSEPGAGSDLATVRTRAARVSGGWIVNGTKVWTTNAHRCQAMIALFRTGTIESRQLGLSQFIVDMPSAGVKVNPIVDLSGEHHFNEVVFEDCFLPDEQLLGIEGAGWAQVTSELALERSGPERFMSSMPLLSDFVGRIGCSPDAANAAAVGRLYARHAVLRQMSLSIAGQLQNRADPQLEAACLKDLGGELEQSVPEILHALLDDEPMSGESSPDYARMLTAVTEMAPSFSLRGGAREVLRGIIARGVGMR